MNLQPLYDVKERLEYAAVAGVSLLGEDFRLQRAAEALKPLAAASPVFGKIDAGLAKLLAAPPEQRSGLLLDVLALVDAVAYTQAKTGMEGELEPLSVGGGAYRQISYGQINPLLTALTTTGGGRMEVVQSAWDNHPEFFQDYRVLPAVIGGLGDSYGEMAELCAQLLKQLGPSVVPALKRGFDPAGKKEMARRVEIIAALEGKNATSWLKGVLPEAKKDVRAAAITALGGDRDNAALLLDLAKSERGKNREAALEALAKQDGEEISAFWSDELAKNDMSVCFLNDSRVDWASDLVAAGLRRQLEDVISSGKQVDTKRREELSRWLAAACGKSSPDMVACWRWVDNHMADILQLKNDIGKPLGLEKPLGNSLMLSLCTAGPGPLCTLCLELWENHKNSPRYLPHAVTAALMTRSAAEVYDTFSPYVLTIKPLLKGEQKKALSDGVLRGLSQVYWDRSLGRYLFHQGGHAPAQPLDRRWVGRLVRAVWKPTAGRFYPFRGGDAVNGFDKTLMDLADPGDPEQCAQLIPYFRQRMRETGSWHSFSHYLLQIGGSPKGVLGESMGKGKNAYLYYVWELLSEAVKVLPPEEVSGLLVEALRSGAIRKEDAALAQRAIPWTVEQLRAGRSFPEWDEWWKMRP